MGIDNRGNKGEGRAKVTFVQFFFSGLHSGSYIQPAIYAHTHAHKVLFSLGLTRALKTHKHTDTRHFCFTWPVFCVLFCLVLLSLYKWSTQKHSFP